MRSPRFVYLRASAVTTPPTVRSSPSRSSRSSASVHVDVAAQRPLGAHQRVVAHVEAEHLLLEREPLRLRRTRRRGSRPGSPSDGFDVGVARRREQARSWPSRSAPAVERPRRRSSRTRCSSPWRGWPSESNAARLDQRLDRALVQHRRVDAVAEVVEVGERPALARAPRRSAPRRPRRRCAPPTARTGSRLPPSASSTVHREVASPTR